MGNTSVLLLRRVAAILLYIQSTRDLNLCKTCIIFSILFDAFTMSVYLREFNDEWVRIRHVRYRFKMATTVVRNCSVRHDLDQ